MDFEIKWGLSGISDEQKAEVQTLIDNEAKIFSKNDKAIEYFKKSYTELSAEIEAIIPYQIAIFYIVDYLREKMPSNAALKNAIQKVIDAFDGAYLWTRIKPLVPELQKINDEQIGEMRFIPWATVILQQAISKIDEINMDEAIEENPQAQKFLIKNYSLMKQGVATNTLTKLKSRKNNTKIDDIVGTATITQDEFSVSITNFKEIAGLRTSTHKLLDALMIEFTETGGKSNTIKMSLKKYMEMRGLKNEIAARRQVDEDLNTLYNVSISFKQKIKGGKFYNYRDMRLVIDKGIKNSVIYCTFHPDFYTLMNSYRVMPMAKKALALDDRYNTNSYYFLKRMSEHMNMNCFKPNKNIISVQTLLDATPEIPSYEEVEKKGRHYKRKIIEPFERDMDALEEIDAIKWEYCHSNGLPLTDEELKNMDYDIFSKLLIKFELIDYPEREFKQLKDKKNSKNKSQ